MEKLNASFGILLQKVKDHFDEDEFERINIIELYIFCWVFNSICYLMLKGNPSLSVLADFGQWVASEITTQILIDQNPNATKEEIDKFFELLVDLSAKRQAEYMVLLQKEMNKPRNTSGFVDLTSGIRSRLFGIKMDSDEAYDLLFSAILAEHISAFSEMIESK